jgi:3,5-epimerase/4-reductase
MCQTWVIFGGYGWIGKQIIKLLESKFINVHIAKSRANDFKSVKEELKQVDNVTNILSCIGRTHGPGYSTIDYLEQPGKLKDNVNDNLFAPIVLANYCVANNIHFT